MKYRNSFFLSILSGLMLGISWPTYGFYFLIFIAFTPLIHLIQSNKTENTFKLTFFSFVAFMVWNIITTHWLYYATLTGMLFAIIVNSILMSLIVLASISIWKKLSYKLSIIFFISLWICFEKFHLNWDFSWPWLNLGNVFSENIKIIQWYEYTGVFGGSLWVLISNFVSYNLLKKLINNENFKSDTIYLSVIILIPIIVSLTIYTNIDIKEEKIKTVIIQPNIDPYNEKFNRSNDQNLNYLESILNDVKNRNSLVILPETYFSDGSLISSLNYSTLIEGLKIIRERYETEILTGIELYEVFNDSSRVKKYSNRLENNRWLDLFNASIFISEDIDIYKKSKLVVGIEKMPYKNFLEPLLGSLLIDFGGLSYSRGYQDYRTVFKSNTGTKVAPIICYESIYGEYVSEYVRNGANLLAIITNDGWWNNTEGHKQHLSYARLRSIETRKNIVRSANTGISAVINYRGEILKTIGYEQEGLINKSVGTNDKITFYTKYGDFIFRLCLFFMMLISAFYVANLLKANK